MDADQGSATGAEGRFKRALVFLFVLIGPTGTISPAADYAIAHVTVINPGRAKPRRDMTIVVHEDAVVPVLPSKQFRPKSSVMVIEKRGKFVLPGLRDMHVHFRDASRDLKMDIANGVLGNRNMGGAPKDVFPLRDAIAAGTQIGPKIVACGLIVDGPDSWSNPQFTVSVRTAEEGRATVESMKNGGAIAARSMMACLEIPTTPSLTKLRSYACESSATPQLYQRSRSIDSGSALLSLETRQRSAPKALPRST